MAGIAGWITRGARRDESALGAMLEAIGHRGVEGLQLVVHRGGQEAVIGAQIHDEGCGVSVVLDGALANEGELQADLQQRGHKFSFRIHAETVLRAYLQWDKEFVRRLRGQFALAIWDSRRARLLLARDRFGEKPLYLYEAGGVLAFASEPKALRRAFALEVDPHSVRSHIEGRLSGKTLYRGVRRLAPGTLALWHFGRLLEARYWTAPDKEPYAGQPVSGAVEAFAGELEDAVRRRPADGVFLSGGLDSAALAVLASRNNPRLQAFTFGLAEDRNSELAAAAEVAKQLGTSHHEVVATPQELAAALPSVVVLRDAPATRPSDVAVHVLCNSAKGAKRVLTGEGCDEVLGGYRRYIAARLKGHFRRDLYEAQTGPLPDELLERTECLGAGASVAAQQPFLDHALAETVSALPDDMRVRGMATKWILREAARALLPKVGRRRHGGFRVAARDVMSNELLLEYLEPPEAAVRKYCDPAPMLEEHLKGKKNHEKTLWTLLNLEIWHRRCASG